MAIINDTTPGRNYALPNAANKLKDDLPRLRLATAAIDTDVTAILLDLADKSAMDHTHTIANVTGLQPALDGRIAVGYHDNLDDLADVSVTGAANGQVLIRQGAEWIPIALQVGNVTGLEALLDGKATPADLAALVDAAPGTLDTLNELAAALGDDPNFATTVTNSIALKAPLASPALTGAPTAPTATAGANTAQIATTAFVATAIAEAKWTSRGIGEIYEVDTSKTGVDIPPTNSPNFRYALLTAGQTGTGAYNSGVLTSESISGAAPLIVATAAIALAGSPMVGQIINLLNTEGRITRPSVAAGTLQEDAMQGHRHSSSGTPNADNRPVGGGAPEGATSGNQTGNPITDGTNGTPRTADETRMKNIGVTCYMRVR